MAFYDRLKESRINAGLTQEQLAEKLGVAKSTLSGYESGNREPTVATIAKALEILGIDANYLYQDETENLTELVVSLDEKTFLKKYRDLDNHGKEMVDMVLEGEHARWEAEHKKAQEPISIVQEQDADYLIPNAARERNGNFKEEERLDDETMLD